MRQIITALLSASVLSVACASGALAADMPAKAPVYKVSAPVAYNWTGCYIGLNAGGAWSRSNFTTVVDPGSHLGAPANLAATSAAGTGSANDSGFIGGGQVGCNLQSGQWVFGLEADFDGITSKPTLNGSGVLTTGDTFTMSNSVKPSWLATVRPRVGFAFDRSLLYATGGLAVTRFKYNQTYFDTLFNTTGTFDTSATKTGWTVGAGWEYAWLPKWTVKLEYLYARFNTTGATGLFFNPGGQNVVHGTADLKEHIIRVGLNYKLWSPGGQ